MRICRSSSRGRSEALLHQELPIGNSPHADCQGHGRPFTTSLPLLEYTLRGVKLRQAKKQVTRPRTRLPITPSLMKKLRSSWEKDSQSHDNIMLWAACCMAFFGFLRSGEITVPSLKEYDPEGHLSMGDVALDNHKDAAVVRVHIKESKTDPFRKGVCLLGKDGERVMPSCSYFSLPRCVRC